MELARRSRGTGLRPRRPQAGLPAVPECVRENRRRARPGPEWRDLGHRQTRSRVRSTGRQGPRRWRLAWRAAPARLPQPGHRRRWRGAAPAAAEDAFSGHCAAVHADPRDPDAVPSRRSEEIVLMSSADPITEFLRARVRAEAHKIDTAPVTLATADASGQPSARIVLLRGADPRGFAFFTNYNSRKGRELEANPRAALCIHWASLDEQIRIEGRVERLPADESDAYFNGRPRGSQLGAWASEPSEVL